MLQCEILKFEAQDIITSSVAVIVKPENPCGCWSDKKGMHICTIENGQHVLRKTYYPDGAVGVLSCAGPDHSCDD